MKVIHIESGLGNQMLSYCEYLAMKNTAVPFRNHRCQKGSDIALRHSFLLGQFC